MTNLADINIQHGNTYPMAKWEFLQDDGSPFDLAGSELVLKTSSGLRLSSLTADNLFIDVNTGTFTWTPTLEETRAIPLGRVARYEIERRIGSEQRTIARGYFIGVPGVNDDV